ncbi:DUF4129 domain-containing protein [Panacibacter ginsenosidivorans]|uniref:DUF4129 domain-containing protein n=1 Tax=Panacibacter ginsenosidivorans TaxID=1813871 RepID=A0A5B8V4D1_9BACT|nr:DUF4129 domain-containing protein [Panacibacter ginsenosidivorans]QEC66244.1 DUF4129 domain-containing protein [Panacibacter ginsenosidivorans]
MKILKNSINTVMLQAVLHLASRVVSLTCTFRSFFSKYMHRYLFLILFFLCNQTVFAQQKLVYDSAAVEVRTFNDTSFQEYKSDADFQYENEVVETPSLWDRFWACVWKKYDEIMSTEAGRATMKFIFWLLGIGGLAFFVYKVARMNRLSLFATEQQSLTAYKVESEDIHAIPFDTAINEALQQGNYRLAIRLSYLQNLKLLTDKELIDWHPNKTNTDYWLEIADTSLQRSFKSVTSIFEYAWYGSHSVTREDFETMKEELLQFKTQL